MDVTKLTLYDVMWANQSTEWLDDPYHVFRDELLAKYYQLPLHMQVMMQLMAIDYGVITISDLNRSLKGLDICDDNDNSFSIKATTDYMQQLYVSGMVLQYANRTEYMCHFLITEVVMREAVAQGNIERWIGALQENITGFLPDFSASGFHHEHCIRAFRCFVSVGNVKEAQRCLSLLERTSHSDPMLSPLVLMGLNPFDIDWLTRLPDELICRAYQEITRMRLLALLPVADLIPVMEKKLARVYDKPSQEFLFIALTDAYLMTGQHQALQDLLNVTDMVEVDAIRGCLAFMQGDSTQAVTLFISGLEKIRRQKGISKKKSHYFRSLSGLFYPMALLTRDNRQSMTLAVEFLQKQPKHMMPPLDRYYQELLVIFKAIYRNDESDGRLVSLCNKQHLPKNFFGLMNAFLHAWFSPKVGVQKKTHIVAINDRLKASQLHWLEYQMPALFSRLEIKENKNSFNVFEHSQWCQVADIYRIKEPWERSLDALSELTSEAKPSVNETQNKTMRLAWFIDTTHRNADIEAREQKILKNGEWSKGRPVGLQRLHHSNTFDYFTDQDRRICACIQEDSGWSGHLGRFYRYHEPSYVFDMVQALTEMAGHPSLFDKHHPTRPLELVTATPELRVRELGDQVEITLHPEMPGGVAGYVVEKRDTRRLAFFNMKETHAKVSAILKKGLKVPKQALEKTQAIISSLAQDVTVHSDFDTEIAQSTLVEPDIAPYIQLSPLDDGLQVRMLIKPFGAAGPDYPPGEGGKNLMVEIENQRLQTKRDLEQETRVCDQLVAACPVLQQQNIQDYDWSIEDTEECFELVLQLHEVSEQANIEWPEGEKFKVTRELSTNHWQVNVKRQRDWFHMSGQLTVDTNKVMDMQSLLALIDTTSSRFLPVGENEFIALTQQFRERLDALAAYTEADKDGRRFAPVSALVMEDVIDELDNVKTDKHWRAHVAQIKSGETLVAEVPSTLTAELRDYQLEGYRWLARLAHWGVGACLADDMGLGKTLQALTYLVKQAPQGPSLVVAPTSVCMNWLDECSRFAPTLMPILLYDVSDRASQLAELTAYDVLICSYGLLQIESDLLSKVAWQVVVLDEAQAIKNMHAKRSKAAMQLQGNFKMIMTGTPVENHLGELWNLFRFINPGLLGSYEQFTARYGQAEQQYSEARQRLKCLIQPFVLRRNKSQVLKELPPRTEIVIQVNMNEEETAFYEALRLRALQNLDNSAEKAGAKHLQVLAEITRLRRACCHPQLVMPDIGISSAKFTVFKNIVAELLENRHKALVFSQFVAHLSLLKAYLDEANIAYQYLDGSTTTKQRKQRVDAFQAGEGDIFLISLKAGGVGLNLTAADYVIHMDPWWNPAVEDQASDRAHRIGQQRPVTIYRLIVAHTIEEQIVKLHQQKRDLADSLLEGTDVSGKITTDELLALLRL